MKNEYLILYAAADLIAHHFVSNKIASLDKNGDLSFSDEVYKKLVKSDKKLVDMLYTLANILSNKISYEAFTGLKNKWDRMLSGFISSKLFDYGYLPVLMGLGMLENYAKNSGNKIYNIKAKTVKKTIKNVIKDRELNVMEKHVLNSFILSEKIYEEIVK